MKDAAHREDTWSAGDAYESDVGRWSRPVAAEFLEWLAVPADARWLDVGCGTGALSETILERAAPREVVGVDAAESFIEFVRSRLRHPRAEIRLGDAKALPCDDAEFDAAVAGLDLNFVPDPAQAVREMKRAVRRGGTVAVYVWDYAGEMQLMRRFWDAAVLLDPAARDLDEGQRFPICQPERLLALWQDAGLVNTPVRVIDIPTVFRDSTTTGCRSSAGRARSGLLRVALRGGTRSTARTPSNHANGGGRRYDSASGPRFRSPRGAAHLRTN
jgi:SAM-dependent methyltransferase